MSRRIRRGRATGNSTTSTSSQWSPDVLDPPGGDGQLDRQVRCKERPDERVESEGHRLGRRAQVPEEGRRQQGNHGKGEDQQRQLGHPLDPVQQGLAVVLPREISVSRLYRRVRSRSFPPSQSERQLLNPLPPFMGDADAFLALVRPVWGVTHSTAAVLHSYLNMHSGETQPEETVMRETSETMERDAEILPALGTWRPA